MNKYLIGPLAVFLAFAAPVTAEDFAAPTRATRECPFYRASRGEEGVSGSEVTPLWSKIRWAAAANEPNEQSGGSDACGQKKCRAADRKANDPAVPPRTLED
jgi:hypothetical protein